MKTAVRTKSVGTITKQELTEVPHPSISSCRGEGKKVGYGERKGTSNGTLPPAPLRPHAKSEKSTLFNCYRVQQPERHCAKTSINQKLVRPLTASREGKKDRCLRSNVVTINQTILSVFGTTI